jgi:hypothetical protein
MGDFLQQPHAEDISFQDLIKGQKSLVVFMRHPG